MADRSGEVFARYRLVRLLGRGGFGEVYEATHPRWGRVALKLLTRQLDERGLNSYLNDVRASLLRHPHVIEILHFGVEGQIAFLAMPYCAAGSLRARYPRGARLPLRTIVHHVQQIAQALQFAHDKGYIHRDVKPDNILIGPQDTLLLADFGIAVIFDAGKTHQTVEEPAGSPEYAAFEQLTHKPCPASDQYALATMVYEWLTGDIPYHADSWVALGIKKAQELPPRLAGIPTLVEQVVLKALAKEPKERYPSVQEFATALESAALFSVTTQVNLPATSAGAPMPVPGVRTVLPSSPQQWGTSQARLGSRGVDALATQEALTEPAVPHPVEDQAAGGTSATEADFQNYLRGVRFPASRDQLLAQARANKTPRWVTSWLETLTTTVIFTSIGEVVRRHKRYLQAQQEVQTAEAASLPEAAPTEAARRIGIIEFQRYLRGVDYPATRAQLIAQARANNAPVDILAQLKELNEPHTFISVSEVMRGYAYHRSLRGVTYPATRDQVLAAARANNAPHVV